LINFVFHLVFWDILEITDKFKVFTNSKVIKKDVKLLAES